MTDHPTDPLRPDPSDRAAAGLNAATGAVHAATEHVADVGRRVKDAVAASQRTQTYLDALKDVTRAAPLGMLLAAFVTGLMLGRRR